jgi:hypothetical protein
MPGQWKIPFPELIEEGEEETGMMHGCKWNIAAGCDKRFFEFTCRCALLDNPNG